VLKIVENLWAVGRSSPNPGEELTPLLRPPSWWGGVAALSPRTPPPLTAFGPSALPPVNNPGHALG